MASDEGEPALSAGAVATQVPAATASEPSVTRFTTRDYAYVRRELRRIAVLAAVIVVTIVVLSFFLP